jgi:hypothetical protein
MPVRADDDMVVRSNAEAGRYLDSLKSAGRRGQVAPGPIVHQTSGARGKPGRRAGPSLFLARAHGGHGEKILPAEWDAADRPRPIPHDSVGHHWVLGSKAKNFCHAV